jgi:L-ribulose-5-phosphate 3-epimerase UlaE
MAIDTSRVKRTVEIDVWLSVYPDGSVGCWGTSEHSDTYSDPGRIACINIKRTVTEGEGL